jgi:hypothetical protein
MRSTACRARTPTGNGDGECSLSGSDTLHELCPTPTPDNASTSISALLNCVFAILETEIRQAVCQLMPQLPQALAELASRLAKLVAPPSRPIPHAGSRCRESIATRASTIGSARRRMPAGRGARVQTYRDVIREPRAPMLRDAPVVGRQSGCCSGGLCRKCIWRMWARRRTNSRRLMRGLSSFLR